MATFEQLAAEYAQLLVEAEDPSSIIPGVAKSIRSLTYTSPANVPLAAEDRLRIVELIGGLLSHKEELPGGGFIGLAGNVRAYLDAVTDLARLLK